MSPSDALLAAAAGVLAGAVNAVAGGGTLISFPALIAVGLPSNAANATNTVAMCAGYLSGTSAQRAELRTFDGQKRALVITGAIGGLVGAILLTVSDEELFSAIVPFLILAACALLLFQPQIRGFAARRSGGGDGTRHESHHAHTKAGLAAIFVTAVYGGYFGAGLGIVVLAVLGILFTLPMSRVNALKGLMQLVINVVAAAFLAIGGDVRWGFAAVVGAGALVGGFAGGKIAPKVNPNVIRFGVVLLGIYVAITFWL